jgi:hypothetical protein
VEADRNPVGGQPDVDLHAVGPVAERRLDRGEGVLGRVSAGAAAVTKNLHTRKGAARKEPPGCRTMAAT